MGFDKTIQYIDLIITSISQIFEGNIAFENAVGGPIMIAKQSAESAERGLDTFLVFMAALSLSLALLNILPIPALDGGHVMFVLYEMITGRKPSQKVLETAQIMGFFIVVGLILLVNGKDVIEEIVAFFG